MSRSVGQTISSVCIDENNDFLIGGWDGEFRKYSRSGDLLWTTTLPDRVGAIEAEKSSIFVTSGLHIVCLDAKTGQIVWQHAQKAVQTTSWFTSPKYTQYHRYTILSIMIS